MEGRHYIERRHISPSPTLAITIRIDTENIPQYAIIGGSSSQKAWQHQSRDELGG